MHLLAAQPGGPADTQDAVDLGQTPGDVVVLSAADSEIACLASAQNALLSRDNGKEKTPSLRLANLLNLSHNLSVDLYVEQVIANAKLVIVRLLGGASYWPYGTQEIAATCREKGILCAFVPGDDQIDAELSAHSTLGGDAVYRLWRYMAEGGPGNATEFLKYAASLLEGKGVAREDDDWSEPAALLKGGLYLPGTGQPTLDDVRKSWKADYPTAALIFYRAFLQAANTAPVDALIKALGKEGVNALPLYVTSLKDPVVAATIEEILIQAPPDVILNGTGFALSRPGGDIAHTPFTKADCPILQVVFSSGNKDAWESGSRGLSARDIAMNVALPEIDGRIFSRAVSFKGSNLRDEACQCDIVTQVPLSDRIDFTARMASAWVRLRKAPASTRRVALILANYPNRDGRLGNGVGLDTPQSTATVMKALEDAGYDVSDRPADGAELIARLSRGPTNSLDKRSLREVREFLPLDEYSRAFAALSPALREQVTQRWGAPEDDPFFSDTLGQKGGFALSVFCCGNITVGLQPARGYNIDPEATYHSPDLVPPHGYFAFYLWLQNSFAAHAIVHMGKHGNLEWLPGKAIALSQDCFPEAALGPIPHLYPFIVNDPGEGSQAKRRAGAVIIDHLTPPLTRAESYGALAELEQLVDEYYEAAGLDPRRLSVLKKEILERLSMTGLDKDCGVSDGESEDESLRKLDAYLCELKEMQIRDGLHIFGQSPQGELLTGLLVALTRTPRNTSQNEERAQDASLLRALAEDLGLSFNPLDCDMAAPWEELRPSILENLNQGGPWRSAGDTVERLELLASALVCGTTKREPAWTKTGPVLEEISSRLRPIVETCGNLEIKGLLSGLDGRFVAPGPSGAPTRGRPDVLPTGRNFYSVDTRTVPTPAAWTLGWKSASLLLERYAQDHGEWPRRLALSAWGTSNMRTGGDDIAQALALMGVQPTWDPASRRLTGFEIMPVSVLGRPRVDVTLRVSGFFRDAFPGLMDLFDAASRAVAALAESQEDNPLAAHVAEQTAKLISDGVGEEDALRRASFRVFGSKPGAYGAGLQALIDEKGWEGDADLAQAYLAWGSYAYGGETFGKKETEAFKERLSKLDGVLHNQDNREHDLLDSDDYYQFEGGMTAAVRHLSGANPNIYHNDHSRPETPKIRTLEEEIARVVRARVVNPKWIKGVMRHGYKGAFEMAATVDYLFAFAATAQAVKDHHFDAVMEAYLEDEEVRSFLEEVNPAALREMSQRLLEALERNLWRPRSNSAFERLDNLAAPLAKKDPDNTDKKGNVP